MYRRCVWTAGLVPVLACAAGPGAEPGPVPADTVVVVDTVMTGSGDVAELREQLAQLQLMILERDGQLDDLRARLDEARREVVRAMAKLQSSATRAEAASAMAEAEVAVRQLRNAGAGGAGELQQAERLLALGNTEFEQQNYEGALYLATEAKTIASQRRGRMRGGSGDMRPGEALFAVPLRLRTSSRSNVRDGPGTRFRVLFTADPGTALLGESYVGQWVRVRDEEGRSGWIFHTLVEARR